MTRLLRCPDLIWLSTLALALLAASMVIVDEWRTDHGNNGQASRAWQRLTRGVGSGSAIDLAGCPRCFDVRLAFVCPQRFSPQPGGDVYCAEHSVAAFEAATGDDARRDRDEANDRKDGSDLDARDEPDESSERDAAARGADAEANDARLP